MFDRIKQIWKKCSSTEVGSYVTQADLKALEERLVKTMTQDRNALDQEIADVTQAQADEAARVNAQIKTLNDTITALQGHASADDFTTEIANLESLKQALIAQLPATTAAPGDTTTTGDNSNGTAAAGQ